MARKRVDEDESERVTKAEFVGLLTLLGQIDRERYRELRAMGWACSFQLESENPN